jgi:leader peptidase (prepilin peptidase) / N-methyltransferase
MLLIYLYIFIVGLVLGSFYNVVGLRMPKKKSIVTPRSACPNCGHVLTAKELVPVFSYVFQKGKCRNCHVRISPLYASMEMLTGLLFVFSFFMFGLEWETIVALTLVSLFMIITVSDLVYMLIPDKVLLFFMVVFLIERICIPLTPWYDSLIGAVVGFALLYIIALISKGGMGGGDIKLYAVLGIALGWKVVLLSFFLSTLIGAIGGSIGMIIGKVERGKPMPFGPYIMIGTLLAYFFHEQIINWYTSMFVM